MFLYKAEMFRLIFNEILLESRLAQLNIKAGNMGQTDNS